MNFGVFDHLDRQGVALADFYEDRLQIVEAYDRAGFYAYHLAEHHSTPLGMAPSPSIFLSAIAQRTRRLRFGPLVWAMPLYHPLRLIEEICMLDHLSRGRLEIGFGRGSAPIELAYYGSNPDEAQETYAEAVELVLRGLTQTFSTSPASAFASAVCRWKWQPLQRPYPPIWYGVHLPDSAERARGAINVVSLDPVPEMRLCIDRYRMIWPQVHPRTIPFPKLGLGRFIVVAPTDAEAMAFARRAYLVWHASFSSCSGAMAARSRIPALRVSTWWSSAARASPLARGRCRIPGAQSTNGMQLYQASPSETSPARNACNRSACSPAR